MRVHPCLLYTPAPRIDAIAKSVPAGTSTVVLDLEDSIPKHAKEAARQRLMSADLSGSGLQGVQVRVNCITTPDGLRDIQVLLEMDGQVGGVPVETIFVPKVAEGRDVAIYRSLLSGLPNPPEICSFIETLDAVENAYDIAAASDGLHFGQADLVSELYSPNEHMVEHARARLCAAAARYGVPAIDTNSFELMDMDVVRAQSEAARRWGFTGKAAIHPRQVETIAAAFTVDPEELDGYRQTIKDYEANATGFAVTKDRVLAPPFVHKARRMLALYENLADPVG
ncbi:MAG: HpcH/HpaI aldolase/citrate lyase family protein [Frankiaceae bacterium]